MALTHSESIGAIATALAAAQGAIKAAEKNAENPDYDKRYADLESVWEACREQLSSNHIAVVQAPSAKKNVVEVVTLLAHSSGEWFRDELTLQAEDASPQGVGSAITYARRYALMAMVGVAPKDDDGALAQGALRLVQPRRRESARRTTPQQPNLFITAAQQREILDAASAAGMPAEDVTSWIKTTYSGWGKVPATEFDRVLAHVKGQHANQRDVM